jgi:SAM-dependent methyltransferase
MTARPLDARARSDDASSASVTCVACGSRELQPVRRYRTESPPGRALLGRLTLYRCSACALVQAAPCPSDEALARYYASDYRSGGRYGSDAADVQRFPRDNLFFFNRGTSIAERVAPRLREVAGDAPRVLDVGAGFGHILHAIGERFPRASLFAQEISEPCVRHLVSLGVETTSEPFEDFVRGRTFDLIVLSHVLEHLTAPAAALARLREALAPHGLLYVEVPNVPPESHRTPLDSAWAPRHDEPHLTFFDTRSLRGVLDGAGLNVELLDTAGPLYREISALRYRLPPLMPTVRRVLPRGVMNVLRRQAQSRGVSLAERDEAFFTYGGRRIWLRSLSRRRD